MAILAALEHSYVSYVLIGGLAQVLRGADLVTSGVDICPSFVKNNLDRLSEAINELGVTGTEGRPVALDEEALTREPVLDVLTGAGELRVIASPAGVPNGYVDLRRAASREDLGQGVRPVVASTGDLGAMAAALGRDEDFARLPSLRRIVELEAHQPRALEQAATPSPPRRTQAAWRGPRLTP